jgi:hypothetical protein
MPSMPVAEQGYRGWQANRRVVVTGARNRMGAALARTLPRSVVLRMVRYIQSPTADPDVRRAPAVVGALLLGALNTFGDFVWARFISSHRAVFGLVHGTLRMAVGLYLGVLRGRPTFGAVAGATVGLLAAASFYALAPLLGYSAMFVSWMALWIGFAFLDARLRGGAAPRETACGVCSRRSAPGRVLGDLGHLAAAGARRPALRHNFACWTLAFLPGFLALLLRGRPARSPSPPVVPRRALRRRPRARREGARPCPTQRADASSDAASLRLSASDASWSARLRPPIRRNAQLTPFFTKLRSSRAPFSTSGSSAGNCASVPSCCGLPGRP